MAEKNDPSIYDDRSAFGSSDELDEYGVWVKSEPQYLSSSLPDVEELPDIDDLDAADSELPDFSDFTSSETDTSGSTGSADMEFEELTDDSELPKSSAGENSFSEVPLDSFLESDSSPGNTNFGNLDTKIPDIEPLGSAEPPSFSAVQAPANQGGIDLSNQLLMKIAEELSSIKKELSSLKTGLSVVHSEVKSEAPSTDSKGGGFFDEEEDEKIALTGDELDNILNTANFTEEAGSGESLNDDLSFDGEEISGLAPLAEGTLEEGTLEESTLSDREDIISETQEEAFPEETGDIHFDDSELTELEGAIKIEDELKSTGEVFDASMDFDSGLPDFDDISSELNDLREMGASPVTAPPEDISYLEEDPLASTPFDNEPDDHIDFSGAVIDEPDLSSQITENPVLEPEIDSISIDIDMEEPVIPEISSPDDFTFETEETMELPVSGTPADGASTGGKGPVDSSTKAEPISSDLKEELKRVLSYMDKLLESLPENKIEEFAKSEYFETYKKLFEELGLA